MTESVKVGAQPMTEIVKVGAQPMTEIVKVGTAEMRLQDCMEYMRTLPDKAFDLAIVD